MSNINRRELLKGFLMTAAAVALPKPALAFIRIKPGSDAGPLSDYVTPENVGAVGDMIVDAWRGQNMALLSDFGLPVSGELEVNGRSYYYVQNPNSGDYPCDIAIVPVCENYDYHTRDEIVADARQIMADFSTQSGGKIQYTAANHNNAAEAACVRPEPVRRDRDRDRDTPATTYTEDNPASTAEQGSGDSEYEARLSIPKPPTAFG